MSSMCNTRTHARTHAHTHAHTHTHCPLQSFPRLQTHARLHELTSHELTLHELTDPRKLARTHNMIAHRSWLRLPISALCRSSEKPPCSCKTSPMNAVKEPLDSCQACMPGKEAHATQNRSADRHSRTSTKIRARPCCVSTSSSIRTQSCEPLRPL